MRHTHATLLLESGVPLHVVASRLGHTDPMVTASMYAAVTPQHEDAAAGVYSDWLESEPDVNAESESAGCWTTVRHANPRN